MDGWLGVDGELRGSKQREITGRKTERHRERKSEDLIVF
jgi:hypothetical protein